MNNEITLSQAFHYCFGQTSYVVSLIVFSIVGIGILIFGIARYKKTGSAVWAVAGLAVGVIMVLAALLGRPVEVKANTTPEQAARGVYIG